MVSSGPLVQAAARKHTNSFLLAYFCASRVTFPDHHSITVACLPVGAVGTISDSAISPRPGKESGQGEAEGEVWGRLYIRVL